MSPELIYFLAACTGTWLSWSSILRLDESVNLKNSHTAYESFEGIVLFILMFFCPIVAVIIGAEHAADVVGEIWERIEFYWNLPDTPRSDPSDVCATIGPSVVYCDMVE